MSARLERLALGAAAVLVAAFVVSFVRGVWRDDAVATTREPAVLHERPPDPHATARGRLEVLNASKRAGLARRATDELRHADFDVVYFGNAPASAPDSSVVIDRGGGPAIARAAADRLGIRHVVTRPDSTLFVDATVILGADWPRQESTAEEETGVWRKVRRLLGG